MARARDTRRFGGAVAGVLASVLAGVALLAACDVVVVPPGDETRESQPSPATPRAFSHVIQGDLSGYYMPVAEVKVGKWTLDHVFLGQEADFSSWEAGRREGQFAPVMLEFVDQTSPMVATELGEVRSGRVRVLPVSYAVTDTGIQFVGTSPEMGAVTFAGRLNPDALATAKRNLGDEGAVMTGTLTAGGQTLAGQAFRWFGGD